jgi:hypothetical protein
MTILSKLEKPTYETTELHKILFEKIKGSSIFPLVERHLEEILDNFKKNPCKVLEIYEKVINMKYLVFCVKLEQLYLYLLLKLSLSELSGKRNVLAYQAEKLEELYRTCRLPHILKEKFPFPILLVNKEERDYFMRNVIEYDRDAYNKLKENIKFFDDLETISKIDEELEYELNKKIASYNSIEKEKFIKYLEDQQPSLCDILKFTTMPL